MIAPRLLRFWLTNDWDACRFEWIDADGRIHYDYCSIEVECYGRAGHRHADVDLCKLTGVPGDVTAELRESIEDVALERSVAHGEFVRFETAAERLEAVETWGAACDGCGEQRDTNPYSVTHPGGGKSMARWCAQCAALAEGNWHGEAEHVEAV